MTMRKMSRFLFSLLLTLLLPSCHYQFGPGELASRYATISIPYAEGDRNGNLTAEVIKKVSSSGAFRYAASDGDLLLKIKVIEVRDQNIGYRYDRKRNEHLKHSIIPSESRFTAVAEVTVIDELRNAAVRGPTLITASLDFDYDYYKVQHGANVFSLGQLNDVDSARDAARHPLDARLAERIADYLLNSW
jgi:hypothetical protein